jgi:hypothetical protein
VNLTAGNGFAHGTRSVHYLRQHLMNPLNHLPPAPVKPV